MNIVELEDLIKMLPDANLREALKPILIFIKDLDEDVATLMSKADIQEEHTHQIH